MVKYGSPVARRPTASLPRTGTIHLLVAPTSPPFRRGTSPLLHRRRAHRDPVPLLADNPVGRVIGTLLRKTSPDDGSGSRRWTTPARNCCYASWRPSTNAAPGIASHWPFESWGRFLPEHTTAVSLLDRLLHHANVVVTDGDSYRMREARARGGTTLKKS